MEKEFNILNYLPFYQEIILFLIFLHVIVFLLLAIFYLKKSRRRASVYLIVFMERGKHSDSDVKAH